MHPLYSALISILGLLFVVVAFVSYPHYAATAVFDAVGVLLFLVLVLTHRRFGQLITSISPAPWPPTSVRGWFGVAMFSVAVTGMVLVVVLRLLYAHKI